MEALDAQSSFAQTYVSGSTLTVWRPSTNLVLERLVADESSCLAGQVVSLAVAGRSGC